MIMRLEVGKGNGRKLPSGLSFIKVLAKIKDYDA